jgi:hypothetical protein
MAGILDNKSRILDVIVTQEGKRQIASNKFSPKFVSFSDGNSFYESDIASGCSDASERIYFEAMSERSDSIIVESDDSGQVIRFDGGPLQIIGDSLFKRVYSGPSKGDFVLVSGSSEFSSISKDLLTGALRNFNDLMLIGNNIETMVDQSFKMSKTQLDFTIDRFTPIPVTEKTSAAIDEIEPMFLDMRLTRADNYMYLPPVNKSLPQRSLGGKARPTLLGEYPDVRQLPDLSFESLLSTLQGDSMPKFGNEIPTSRPHKPLQTIDFTNTSIENNLIIQMFESNGETGLLKKLDIIDFGQFYSPSYDIHIQNIYFVGKVFLTESGLPTFVNLFTIIIE